MKLLNKLMLDSSTVLFLKLGLVGCLLAVSFPALAEQQAVSPSPRAYLEHIIDAENSQSFKGVFNYDRPGYKVESYVHQQVSEDGQVLQWVKKTNTEEGFLRLNGKIKCVTNGYKSRFRVNTILQSIEKSDIDSLLQDYNVTVSLNEVKVGERPAYELIFQAKDEDRYIYKLAFDKETSFPIQFIFLDDKNNVLETGKFTQFIPVAHQDMQIKPLANCVDVKYKQINNDRSDWLVDWKPSGFGLERVFNQPDTSDEHLVYSDGLVSFSVFIEPLVDKRMGDIERNFGATIVVARKAVAKDNKQYSVTVVGEIPLSTAQRIAASVHQ